MPAKSPLIQRNSILTESFEDSKNNSNSHKSKNHKYKEENPVKKSNPLLASLVTSRPQSPLTTMISFDEGGGVTRADTFKVIGKEEGIGVPLPLATDIPEGMNVHLIEIPREDKHSLGISLVPGVGKSAGFFQVSQTIQFIRSLVNFKF